MDKSINIGSSSSSEEWDESDEYPSFKSVPVSLPTINCGILHGMLDGIRFFTKFGIRLNCDLNWFFGTNVVGLNEEELDTECDLLWDGKCGNGSSFG